LLLPKNTFRTLNKFSYRIKRFVKRFIRYFFTPDAASATDKLTAGTAKVNITPPDPRYPVHDSLYARVLILEVENSRIAFIAPDWGGYTNIPLAEKLKSRFTLNEVYFCPQHTHSGQTVPAEWMEERITSAMETASGNRCRRENMLKQLENYYRMMKIFKE
jgi:hypothetical protein